MATSHETLPVRWEELTATDFVEAAERAKGVCALPIGVIEKHGPHLPLGTDVMAVREVSVRAAEREYVVVFPHYYFGQIYEARHQPGCVTIPPELLTALLQAVCDDIGRNGFEKILIVDGHGGNTAWLRYFCQTQLARRTPYVVFTATSYEAELDAQIQAMRKTDWGGHADEIETACMMEIRPDLVHLDRAGAESGLPMKRMTVQDVNTAMRWYADFPNHYAGDPSGAAAELGSLVVEAQVRGLAEVFRSVKEDETTRKLQEEFYTRSERPVG
jgi:creatinine amidohydrolase